VPKKIEAIVQEDKLGEVKEALKRIGIVGMNVTEVRGHGRQGGLTLAGRSGTYQVDMLPRIQFNIILSDHNVEKTVEAICQAAYTGNEGDGMIFIYPVEDVIRIRTRERGRAALMYPDDIDVRAGTGPKPTNGGNNGKNGAATTPAASKASGEPAAKRS
jgi:nitrogen regulatory protein P-II 1